MCLCYRKNQNIWQWCKPPNGLRTWRRASIHCPKWIWLGSQCGGARYHEWAPTCTAFQGQGFGREPVWVCQPGGAEIPLHRQYEPDQKGHQREGDSEKSGGVSSGGPRAGAEFSTRSCCQGPGPLCAASAVSLLWQVTHPCLFFIHSFACYPTGWEPVRHQMWILEPRFQEFALLYWTSLIRVHTVLHKFRCINFFNILITRISWYVVF